MEEKESSSDRAARIISLLTIAPFQIVLYMTFAWVICHDFREELLLNTFSGIFFLLIPFIPLLYVAQKEQDKNYSIPIEKRYILFLVQIITFSCASIFYYFYPLWRGVNTEILFIFTVGYTILMAVSLVITTGFNFKMSLHMTGAVSSITALVIVLGWWLVLLYLFCIPIGWSRIKLQAHKTSQVIIGAIVGILTIFFTYLGFGYIF
ncbi:MAG: hypothetical protein HWN66_16450 [Candidatus Helarchaeota archaeon]|nr:hypothetical protein [Candidatus Helarchaeota archaeon]